MLDPPRHDEELAFVKFDDSLAEVDGETAAEDQEELVFLFVMMPHELAFELRDLDVLAVHLADDPRAPAFRELLEFLGEVHLLCPAVAHARLPNGSAFSGVRQPGTAAANASDYAILPRLVSAQREHARCNALLGSHPLLT